MNSHTFVNNDDDDRFKKKKEKELNLDTERQRPFSQLKIAHLADMMKKYSSFQGFFFLVMHPNYYEL